MFFKINIVYFKSHFLFNENYFWVDQWKSELPSATFLKYLKVNFKLATFLSYKMYYRNFKIIANQKFDITLEYTLRFQYVTNFNCVQI